MAQLRDMTAVVWLGSSHQIVLMIIARGTGGLQPVLTSVYINAEIVLFLCWGVAGTMLLTAHNSGKLLLISKIAVAHTLHGCYISAVPAQQPPAWCLVSVRPVATIMH